MEQADQFVTLNELGKTIIVVFHSFQKYPAEFVDVIAAAVMPSENAGLS